VEGLKAGAVIKILESKTGKKNVLVINKSVYKALQLYIKEKNPAPDDYLFKSRKGSGHISSQSVGRNPLQALQPQQPSRNNAVPGHRR